MIPGLPDSPVPSPCVGVCRIDAASGCCAGCWRLLDEIAAWPGASEARRREIWALVRVRQAAAGEAGTGSDPTV